MISMPQRLMRNISALRTTQAEIVRGRMLVRNRSDRITRITVTADIFDNKRRDDPRQHGDDHEENTDDYRLQAGGDQA